MILPQPIFVCIWISDPTYAIYKKLATTKDMKSPIKTYKSWYMGVLVQFLDIIIFAVIAVLLVLRLRSVLGQRTGYDEPQDQSNMVRFRQIDKDNEPIMLHPDNQGSSVIAEKGLDALRRMDRSFSEKEFLSGATMAFDMILKAYAEGDLAQLKRLLGYDLLQSFTTSVQERNRAGESLTITLEDIKEASILKITVRDQIANITVHFNSVQTRVARDVDGEPIDGGDTGPSEYTDIWTFERDLSLADPNWKLVETESPDTDD